MFICMYIAMRIVFGVIFLEESIVYLESYRKDVIHGMNKAWHEFGAADVCVFCKMLSQSSQSFVLKA